MADEKKGVYAHVTGWLPAATTWRTSYLSFRGVAARRRIGDVIAANPQRVRSDAWLAVSNWRGGAGFEFVPGRGMVRRQAFFGFTGVLARRPVRAGAIFATPAPGTAGFISFYRTDAPLGTGGVGRDLSTEAVVQAHPVEGRLYAADTWVIF